MKLVINGSFGGWWLSENQAAMLNTSVFNDSSEVRTDLRLIASVEAGDRGNNNDFVVISIPDGAHYVINDYDGIETVYWSMSPISKIEGGEE